MVGKLNGPTVTKYRDAYPAALIAHMSQGRSFESFGGTIGVTISALTGWVNTIQAFRDAKDIGQLKSRDWWETLGRGGAAGKIKGFNAAAWIFNMKNRFGWKDNLAISGDEQRPIMVAYDHSKRLNPPDVNPSDY